MKELEVNRHRCLIYLPNLEDYSQTLMIPCFKKQRNLSHLSAARTYFSHQLMLLQLLKAIKQTFQKRSHLCTARNFTNLIRHQPQCPKYLKQIKGKEDSEMELSQQLINLQCINSHKVMPI
jgi:uncharacterized protein YciW